MNRTWFVRGAWTAVGIVLVAALALVYVESRRPPAFVPPYIDATVTLPTAAPVQLPRMPVPDKPVFLQMAGDDGRLTITTLTDQVRPGEMLVAKNHRTAVPVEGIWGDDRGMTLVLDVEADDIVEISVIGNPVDPTPPLAPQFSFSKVEPAAPAKKP